LFFGLTAKVNADGYQYYRPITVTSDTNIAPGTITNFPMLFSGTYDWLAATSLSANGLLQNENGYDHIYSTSTDCLSPLKYQNVSYTASTGAITDWVNVPTMTAGAVIYICYGNASITTSQADVAGTWADQSLAGYWQLDDASGTTVHDTSINNTTGTWIGTLGSQWASGKIGVGAGSFSVTDNNQLKIPAFIGSKFNTQLPFTVSFWANPGVQGKLGDNSSNPILFNIPKDNSTGWATPVLNISTDYSTGDLQKFYVTFRDSAGTSNQSPTILYTPGNWTYLTITWDGTNLSMFKDGVSWAQRTPNGFYAATSGTAILLSNNLGGHTTRFNGLMDDVRIYNRSESSNEVTTSYNNQNSPATFYSVGGQSSSLSDTTPPSVSWTSPIPNSSLSSAVTLTTSSTDDVGVSKVDLYFGPLGSEFASSTPIGSVTDSGSATYSLSWNTSFITNGAKTLWAVSTDTSNNTSIASITVYVENPPVVSSVFATPDATTNATITWNTNETATSQVNYGPTNGYGSSATDLTLVTNHLISLSGLVAGTTYHYQVLSTDSEGNTTTSTDKTFTAGMLTVNIPANGSIQAAVNANPAGTTFNLAAGTYYNQSVQPKDGDIFVGAIGEDGSRLTIMTGAQPLSNFTQNPDGIWYATTTQTTTGQKTGSCLSDHPRCQYPEDLFYDGQPYFNTTSTSALTTGSFYFDYPNGTIYFLPANVGENPNSHSLLYTRTKNAFHGTSINNVTIKNIVVEYYASPAQFGAIGDQFRGAGWTIDNVESFSNHGVGIGAGTNWVVKNSYVHDNGEMGIGGGNSAHIEGNEISHNVDYAGFSCTWECGPFKSTGSSVTLEGNYIHDNVGDGIWFDQYATNNTIQDNVIKNNTGAGISYEISYSGLIRNNILIGNGSRCLGSCWLWDGEIQVQNSQSVEAYGNVMVLTASLSKGLAMVNQYRTDRNGAYLPVQNNFFHDNTISYYSRVKGLNGIGTDYDLLNFATTSQSTNIFKNNHYHNDFGSTQIDHIWEFFDSSGVSHNINLFSSQALGFEASSTLDSVIPSVSNTQPPVVNIISPSAGAIVSGNSVFQSSASGVPVIAQVQFQIDGQDTGLNSYTSPYQTTIDTTQLSNGAHTLNAIAYDTAGNTATASEIFSVDNTAHTITASAGANGTITPSGSVSVNNGSDQAFTITPNSGYHIDTVTADSVAALATSPYTFTNVTIDHTISTTFAADSAPVVTGGGPLITGSGYVYVPPIINPITPIISTTIPIIIPGCNNGTNGFSITTGQSCLGNTGGITTTIPPTLQPQITPYNFGTTTLRFWSKGEAVKELQRFLNKNLNLNLKVDGVLGLKTIAIIKQWQKSHGLVADGLVGAKTKAKMNTMGN